MMDAVGGEDLRGEDTQEPAGQLVTVVASAKWSRKWLAEQHMSRRLREHFVVLLVDPPTTIASAARRHRGRIEPRFKLTEVESGLFLLNSRVVVGRSRPGLWRYAETQLAGSIRRAEEELGIRRCATIIANPDYRVFPEGGGKRIYWAKDDHQSGAEVYGDSGHRIARRETRIIEQADAVVVVSEELQARWSGRGVRTKLIENGCDFSHFSEAECAPLPNHLQDIGPHAVFIGTLGDRIDERLLLACARSGIRVVIVGGQRVKPPWRAMESLQNEPNLFFVGSQPYHALPAFARHARVGLIPYRQTEYNSASFPLKLFEYLAAGTPVVSSLPVRSSLAIGPPVLAVDGTASGFVEEVARALDRDLTPAESMEMMSIARANDWSQRALQMKQLIDEG